MFNGGELQRQVRLGVLPNNAAPQYHHEEMSDRPSGGHSMKQLTRTLKVS